MALLSGVAASYCIARPNLSSALAGVAIAAALVPPIATVGIAIALGELGVARGAAILFATNVVAIILGAALTFSATGVRASRSEGRRPLWVRRTILGLVLCAVAIAVPLGSVLISKVAKRLVAHAQERSIIRVPDELYEILRSEIGSLGDDCELERATAYREGGGQTLELEIIAPEVPGEEFVRALAEKASASSGQETRVRILTRLLVDSD